MSETAVELFPNWTEPEERVFKGLKYSAYHNVALFKWVTEAGITKHITYPLFAAHKCSATP
ncbi:MAG: hypothetical protein HRT57_07945 [Crocinitomicaceae bacterium]|nr:hypothetical protein [Crocinitomicaceae bacterium]